MCREIPFAVSYFLYIYILNLKRKHILVLSFAMRSHLSQAISFTYITFCGGYARWAARPVSVHL